MMPGYPSKFTLYKQWVIIVTGFLSLVFVNVAEAALVPDAGTMIKNITAAVPNLILFTTALGYVLGMFMVFQGIMKLKQYGEQRTMMSSQYELKGPLMYIFVGAALLYLPSSLQTATSTFWGNTSPLEYVPASGDAWSSLIQDCFMIIQLIGYVAFIRGLMILAKVGSHGGHQDSFGKAMAHIIGGTLCINMYQFIQTISNTLGLAQI
ncbi:hypothetical protein AYO45_04550 [Gammaproteobacteria bacterium SCGC AG-212-F23]|nr:hypothetical protein AYO45_04550 [Gammaproteobacteria bacterium SCGC AG-212-F23]